MVDRVETVTGGASAQYGSDAVSGVVNVILKKHFTGLEARAQAGISEEGDYATQRLGFIAGTSFAQDRGRSEEHTSELQSLMRISYAVFYLNKHTIPTHNR